jgi:plasmid stabilization system protein ParE
MKVIVRQTAQRDLDDIFDWISQDSPRAAAQVVRRVLAAIDRLTFSGLSQWAARV